MNRSTNGLLVVCLLACACTSYAQRATDVAKWSIETVRQTRNSATLKLSVTVSDGWHIYALSQPPGGSTPLKITVPNTSPFTLAGPIPETNVTRHFDENFNMETLYYLKSASFDVGVRATEAAPAETLPIDVRFQACSGRLCLPPFTSHLTAVLKGK